MNERIPQLRADPNVPGLFRDRVSRAFTEAKLNAAFAKARVEGNDGFAGHAVVVDNGRIIANVGREAGETPEAAKLRAIEEAHRKGLQDPVVAVIQYIPTRRELSQKS